MTTKYIARHLGISQDRVIQAIHGLRLDNRGLAEKHGPVWWVLPDGIELIRSRIGKAGTRLSND